MTLQIAPARPSLAMYGKSLAETTAIKSWMMRRIGQTAIPPSSLRRGVDGLAAPSVQAMAYSRGTPSPWPGQGRGPKRWPVAPHGTAPGTVPGLGDTVAVKDWQYRRIWKKRIPASSLMGLGELGRHVGTAAERRWGVNPLSETTYVEDTAPRRVGMDRWQGRDGDWHEQAMISGFGAFGALDAHVPTRDWQTTLRKLGICTAADGRAMAVDGLWGPITQSASEVALRQLLGLSNPAASLSAAARATEVATTSEVWTHLQSLAEGRIDQCGASRSTGTGTSTTGGTTTTTGGGGGGSTTDTTGGGGSTTDTTGGGAAASSSWMSSPWLWLGVAAAVGVGAFVVMNKDESGAADGETFLIPDPNF